MFRFAGAVKKSDEGTVSLLVRVQPRSSRKGVDGVVEGSLRVRRTAPPAEGAANAQLVEVLSKEFGIKKSAIKIVRGHASRDKLVEVEGL
jgi:uncharacterized protein (TIGR00251 family)